MGQSLSLIQICGAFGIQTQFLSFVHLKDRSGGVAQKLFGAHERGIALEQLSKGSPDDGNTGVGGALPRKESVAIAVLDAHTVLNERSCAQVSPFAHWYLGSAQDLSCFGRQKHNGSASEQFVGGKLNGEHVSGAGQDVNGVQISNVASDLED